MKRQRGRGRKPGGGNQGNRPFESNGPDVKIRGTAAQIYEKYAQYARDAQSSGDRVKYESYLQHAEHYFRIMAATMPREQRIQQMDEQASLNGGEGRDADGAPHDSSRNEEGDDDAAEASNESDDAEGGDDEEAAAAASSEPSGEGEGDGEGPARGRRRRGRRRPADSERGSGGSGNAGGDTEARSALDSLARKQGALSGG